MHIQLLSMQVSFNSYHAFITSLPSSSVLLGVGVAVLLVVGVAVLLIVNDACLIMFTATTLMV